MSSSNGCGNDCTELPDFPRRITNRPGLDTIDYRIGDYTAMRAHMLAAIDAAPALTAWTHRRADDPGIALIEASAIVGDILSLYQQTYANEAFLRTAAWRDTVAELVRVIGYRLAPGLGGRARFSIAVKGLLPVTLPKGFAITAKLPSAPKPAQFEATEALVARPALSKFHLYRPRHVPSIINGSDTFQLDIGNDVALAKGDRLMVGTAVNRTLRHTQILVVEKVWESFGVRLVKTQGKIASLVGPNHLFAPAFLNPISLSLPLSLPIPLALNVTAGQLTSGIAFLPAYSGFLQAGLATALIASASELRVYKLGPSVRHFGHSAPPTRVAVDTNGHATEVGVTFSRRLNSTQGNPVAPSLRANQWPLDGEPPGFAAGTPVLIEANLSGSEGGNAAKRVIERDVTQIDRQSLAWGTATGASTVLGLDDDLAISEGTTNFAWTDIRGVTLHAVQGEPFRMRAASQATSAARGRLLDYFGSHDDALALQDRTVLLAGSGTPASAQVQAITARPASSDPQFHTLTLDTEVALSDYNHLTPRIDVYGNLLDTTEGKTEAEVPIGDGDARADFQTFALPKAPLTYLLDTAAQPPQVPELEIRIGGVLWQRVPSLFGRGRKEAIYIVRESGDGASPSYVQFGDGRNGARLPSGKGNVVAHWRTGSGAHGLPAGTDKPSAAKRLPGFDDVFMLEPATGGALPENAANAKRAAPATMQSLGRIVSLADFEAEALLLPGVLKANAAWQLLDGVPLVALTVLIASGAAADAAAVDIALRHALAARGPARWSLHVRHGSRRSVQMELALAIDPALRNDDIVPLIQSALGVEDNDPTDDADLGERGLMHWRMRSFGQAVHGSQIVGTVQRVDGVRWVELRSFALTSTGRLLVTPLLLTPILFIKTPPLRRSLRAAADELLTLPRAGLRLNFVSDQEAPR